MKKKKKCWVWLLAQLLLFQFLILLKWLHNSFNEEQMAHVNRPYSILWMGLGMRNCWRGDPGSWLAALAHTCTLWLDDWRSIWPRPKRGRTVAVSVYVCFQTSRLMLQPSWEMLPLVLSTTRLGGSPFREKESTVHFCCYRFCALRKKKQEVHFWCFLCLTAFMRKVNSLIHFYAHMCSFTIIICCSTIIYMQATDKISCCSLLVEVTAG